MDPASWQRIQELFHLALELEPAERAAFLDRACGDDGPLKTRIARLLAAEEGAEGRISQAIRGTFELAAAGRRARQTIGPYRVLQEIGRGGMSTVYLAERGGDFHQRVAIKVVRRGMDTEDVLQRLRQERQILASLDHPNIARLLDGGNTDDGLPYFVIEYIEGEPIDSYCDRRRLGISERLELFGDVCAAVAYAHRNLVIHRDVKPSNLLVTAAGTPKLLDFGIAKLLDPGFHPELAAHTITGVQLLTPEYASPEQLRGETLTTATDVYSLGVLLYELLTGHRPYPVDRSLRLELMRSICETEPEKPSAAILRQAKVADAEQGLIALTPERVSAARQERPDRLRMRLSGDLDTIVLTALRKEPERRYASVEALADDLRRHLAGLPVKARGDTFGYRLGKFVRRHRLALATAAAVVVLVAVLVGFYTARLAAERDRAQREERESAQVADFLRDLFERSDPGRSRGEEVTARELLDQGAVRINSELRDQPQLRAELMDLMATVYTSLGLYRDAEPLLEESLAIRRRLHGPEHPDVAASLHSRGRWLHGSGRYAEAEEVLRSALALRRRLLGESHRSVADSLNALADVLYDRGEHEQAERLFSESLALRRRLSGPEHPDIADSLNDMALAMYAKEDHQAAEPLLREALALRRQLFGDGHPDVAETLSNLATVRLFAGDVAEAEELYRRVLKLRRGIYGHQHPQVAHSLNNLGELLRRQGDFEAAEALLREALDIVRSRQGESHPEYVEGLMNLAGTLQLKGGHEEAVALHRQALATARTVLGPDHPYVPVILMNLGDALIARGELGEAEDLYRQALQLRRRILAADDWRMSSPLVGLGRILLAQGEPDEAEVTLREAVGLLHRARPDHWRTAEAESLLGVCLGDLGRHGEAEALLVSSLPRLEAALGADAAPAAEAREALGRLGVR